MKTEQHPTSRPSAERLTPLEVLTLILSVIVLGVLLAESIFDFTPAERQILDAIDFGVCCVFLLDFGARFRRAPSKLAFMKWGWIDIVSSIPVVDALRWGRLVRVVRVLRLLRAFRSTRTLLMYFLRHESLGTFGSVIAIFGLVVGFAAVGVLHVERNEPTATIRTAGDAFWWSIVTVTTVGYGDMRPVTTEGRVVAGMLMIAGVGLFGTLSGLVASLLVNPGIRHEETEILALTMEIRRLGEKVERLELSLPIPPSALLTSNPGDPPPA